jgi:hypothetical protein
MSASGTLNPANTVSTSAGSVRFARASRCIPSSLGCVSPNESATWAFMKYDVFWLMWLLQRRIA